MSPEVTRPSGRRATRLWLALAVGLAVVAAVCMVVWSSRSARPPQDAPDAAVPATAGSTVAAPRAVRPAVAPVVRPVELEIPSIGLDTRLTTLGLQPDGTVEVPSDPALAGWYRRGPAPGALGSAVILGHVDSTHGPAVFYNLSDLHPGDAIRVRLEDGTTTRFVVHSVNVYANADFPAQKVYGAHGRPELNLVTCGGTYDAAQGGYQANVVINARSAVAVS